MLIYVADLFRLQEGPLGCGLINKSKRENALGQSCYKKDTTWKLTLSHHKKDTNHVKLCCRAFMGTKYPIVGRDEGH